MEEASVEELSKPELKASLRSILQENIRLRETVCRLLRQNNAPIKVRFPSHSEDSVPSGWVEQHRIEVPRADGIFESREAWIRIKNGVIIGAGLKNESILHLAVSLELLDQGAERHANLYKDWRAAFLSRLDPTRMGDSGNETPEAWSKEDCYSKLLHRVDEDHLEAMNCIVAIRPKAKHLAAFQTNRTAFVAAFNTVAKAMMAIEDEAREALQRISRQ